MHVHKDTVRHRVEWNEAVRKADVHAFSASSIAASSRSWVRVS
jgi:hypothetical protein